MTRDARSTTPTVDPTHYPVEVKVPVPGPVPESRAHQLISTELREQHERFLAGHGEIVRVGSSPFLYWVQHDPMLHNVATGGSIAAAPRHRSAWCKGAPQTCEPRSRGNTRADEAAVGAGLAGGRRPSPGRAPSTDMVR